MVARKSSLNLKLGVKAGAFRLFDPRKSAKLNGAVERANRTHSEGFYEVSDCTWTVEGLHP